MKMIPIHFVILILGLSSNFAQSTFSRYYDYKGDQYNLASQIRKFEDQIFLLGYTQVNTSIHSDFLILNDDGEEIYNHRFHNAWIRDLTEIRDSVFYSWTYYRGRSRELHVQQYSVYGELLQSVSTTIDNAYNIDFFKIQRSEDKIVTAGQIRVSENNRTIVKGVIVIFDLELNKEKTITIEPTMNLVRMGDIDFDEEGNFYVSYDDLLDDGKDIRNRTIRKYSAQGELLFQYPDFSFDDGEFSLVLSALLSNGDIVLDLYGQISRSTNNPNEMYDLICYGPQGEIRWLTNLDPISTMAGRRIDKLIETEDGNIILVGQSYSNRDRVASIGFMIKVDASNGNLLWAREYIDWNSVNLIGNQQTVNSILYDIIDKGDVLYSSGRMQYSTLSDTTGYQQYYDYWLLKTDKEGCLQSDCGGLYVNLTDNEVYEGFVETSKIYGNWYYAEPDAQEGIEKVAILRYGLDNYFKTYRTEQYFDIILPYYEKFDDDFIGQSENGRQVFLHDENGENQVLLYDFSLEQGDYFESSYSTHTLQVVETDTMRLTNKKKLQYWELACVDNPQYRIRWIDEIGTYYGIKWPKDFCNGDYGNKRFNCYYRYERLYHMHPDVDDCLFTTSIEESVDNKLEEVRLVPNPGMESVRFLGLEQIGRFNLNIFNTQGHSLLKEEISGNRKASIDISWLASGVYYFHLTHTDKSVVLKFIKM